jgi:hypothetical protein
MRTLAALSLLALLAAACSALPAASEDVATLAVLVETAAPLPETEDAPPATAEPTQAADLPPIDVLFSSDCSQIDPARQSDCDEFIAQTSTLVYPRLVQLTGTTLANCYKEVTYTIIPNDSTAQAGGYTYLNAITYMEAYSIDSNIPYDVHELIHSFSWCSTALDFHMFHGALMNAVYNQLGDAQFSQYPSEADTREELTRLRELIAGMPADETRFDYCTGALADWVTITHFQVGDAAVPLMYQSTINAAPLNPPSELAAIIWRATAPAAQALAETITQQLGSIELPECGF